MYHTVFPNEGRGYDTSDRVPPAIKQPMMPTSYTLRNRDRSTDRLQEDRKKSATMPKLPSELYTLS